MDKKELIRNIALRTGGDIYLGVVGAVRTGKSTFIKKVLENLILPNITDEYEKKRALDEIPQSAKGKTIMTIEPKFVPNNIAKVKIDDLECNMRLVDCVGYVIPSAKGFEDENGPRMVKTPWYNDEIPFIEAAEIGTEKVIKDHSTIGIIVTTDGSIGEFERKEYTEAEERVVGELVNINKPFIMVLNSTHPNNPETLHLADELRNKYNVPVLPMDVLAMNEKDTYDILKEALYEFPVLEVKVRMPEWIGVLSHEHYVKKAYIEKIKDSVIEVDKLRDIDTITTHFEGCEYIERAYLSEVNPATGEATITLDAPSGLFEQILNEMIGVEVASKASLLAMFQDYQESKREYDQVKAALKMVKTTGYGVANPTIQDMKLDQPEVVKQGSRYGIKLKATAPSIHIITIKMLWRDLIDGLMREVESHLSLFMKWKVMLV